MDQKNQYCSDYCSKFLMLVWCSSRSDGVMLIVS